MVGTTKFRITNKEVLDFLSSEDRQKCNSLIFTNVQKDELGEEITVTCLCFNDEDKEEENVYERNLRIDYYIEEENYIKAFFEDGSIVFYNKPFLKPKCSLGMIRCVDKFKNAQISIKKENCLLSFELVDILKLNKKWEFTSDEYKKFKELMENE